jgi:hypothetical protein
MGEVYDAELPIDSHLGGRQAHSPGLAAFFHQALDQLFPSPIPDGNGGGWSAQAKIPDFFDGKVGRIF